jgi:CubicO group peptidase (beta-lactamase class C family)
MAHWMRSFGAGAVLALALCLAVVNGQEPQPQEPQQPEIFSPGGTLPLLETYLESMRQQAGIPGMSAAVLRDRDIVWDKGFGYQDVAARIRATPDTPYLVGDASGTLAAILLLQCVEQGHVGLDEPFFRYGLSAPDQFSTLRGLLSHSSGDGFRDAFSYSPERYSHLTELMEWCAPQPYRKSVAHRILSHLEMFDSAPGTDWNTGSIPWDLFDQDDIDRYRGVLDRMALPYRVLSRTKVEHTDLAPVGMTASGGLVSTVRDLAKLDRALDRFDLLQNSTIQAAWTPVLDRTGSVTPMGLGWFVQSYRGEPLVWHFGYVPNAYSSLILKLPSRNLTFILLANSDGLSSPFDLAQGDVTRSLFATVFLRLTT